VFDAEKLRGTADHISFRGVEGAARAKSSVRTTMADAEGAEVCHAPRGPAPPRLENYRKFVKMRGRGCSRLNDPPSDGGLMQWHFGGTYSPN